MSKKPPKSKTPKPPAKTRNTIVLFGLDEDSKPRAARFAEENDALLAKAAAAMGLRLAIPETSQHFELVNKLPVGRLYATGKGFVPNVSKEVYDQIVTAVGGEPGAISTVLPKSWDDVAPGHLVVAQDSVANGWFPAVVTKRHDDTLTLKWRDYPAQPEVIRPITAVALLKTD